MRQRAAEDGDRPGGRWVLADRGRTRPATGPPRWLGPCALRPGGRYHLVPAAEVPAGAPVVALGGTLLPPLRDAHVHAGLVDLRAVRAGGVAAVHDLGGVPADLAAILRAAADPAAGLPRVEVAGAFLTAPGGYPSDRPWAAPGSWRELRSGADAAVAVAEQLRLGARRVKVALNAAAGPVPERRVLAAVVDAAHRGGVEVVAHVEGAGTVAAALSAGVDVFAHAPWTERLEPGLLRAAARQQSGWVSTLDIHGRGRPSAAAGTAVANCRGYLAHGGRLVYGTDLGNGPLPAGVNAGEVRLLRAVGLSADDVLAAMVDTPSAGESATWLPPDPGTDLAAALATARVLPADPAHWATQPPSTTYEAP